MIHDGLKFFLFVTAIFMEFPLPGTAVRYSNCLGRCELEVFNTHELFVRAEDILSFQRFFDPDIIGDILRDVTSLRVECSQALLGETLRPFQSSWVPFIAKILELRIQECRVVSLAPAALREFKSLTSLRIDNAEEGSPFMAEEGGLEGLRNLASFSLTRVRLRTLNHSLFHNHTSNKLMKVYLSHNSLDDIDQCTFCGMQRLSDLDLSFNQLRGSSMDFLQCVHALYLLNVSHNAILSVNVDAFQYNEILHTVDLSHNKLNSFSSVVHLLNRTKTLREVFLANNPWKCNVTSLVQLRYLGSVTGVQIADWDSLKCLDKGKWITAQQLVFPFTFGQIFRFWHAMLIVAFIFLCFCSVLAVKCFAEPLHETLPVALWHLMRNSLRPSSRRMEFTESLPSKIQRSDNSGKLLCAEEGRSHFGNCESSHTGKDNNGKVDAARQVSEIIIGNIIAENNKKIDPAASPAALVKSSNNVSRQRTSKESSSVSCVSYKTSLDASARGEEDHKSNSKSHNQNSRSTSKQNEKNEDMKGNGESKQVNNDGENGNDDILENVETQNEEDLPLTTSAGVATTPTETQTMAMAGVRGLRQFGTASWMTVAQPHLSTSMDSESSPSHNLPTPVEFVDAKMGRRNTSVDFTLHSPPSTQGGQGPPLRNYNKSENVQNYFQSGTLAHHASCQPVILEEKKSFRNVWSTTRVYPTNRVAEMPVCRSCLEALSLPDVNNTSYVWEDNQNHGVPVQQQTPFGKTASFRQHRGMNSGFEGAEENSSPIMHGKYIRRPRRNGADKSIYRSLERGTRRRAVDYRSRMASQDKYFYELSMQNKEHIAVNEATHSGNVLNRLSHTKKTSEVFVKQIDSTAPNDREVSSQGIVSECNSTLIQRNESERSASNVRKAPAREDSTGPRKKSDTNEEEISHRDQECQYESSARRRSPPKSTTPVEDDGDHCDIDIEEQASQIIDMVELHAQSNCKTS